LSSSDEARVIENFMDELCKRHKDAMNNGSSTKFRITSIYNQHLAGFDRSFVDKVLEEFLKEGLVSANNDIVELTKTGKQFCSDKNR
jgi:predicted methyltransferase